MMADGKGCVARFTVLLLCGWVLAMLAGCKGGEGDASAYPTRPVTLVVPFSAGGPTDVLARTLAGPMAQTLGQSIVVENKPGAGGTIAAGYVARAHPDGYTLLVHHTGMATSKALYKDLAYDPLTSFELIGQVVDVPMTLVGRQDLPPNTLQELIAYIKANKATLNFAHAGAGSVSHLCAMLLQQALGVELTTVQFQGTAPALVAVVGGHVDVLCDLTTQTIPHIKAGRVKLYGVTTRARIAALPDTDDLGGGWTAWVRGGGLARHLRSQRNSQGGAGQSRRCVACSAEGSDRDAAPDRAGSADRPRGRPDPLWTARPAGGRDRQVDADHPQRRRLGGLKSSDR